MDEYEQYIESEFWNIMEFQAYDDEECTLEIAERGVVELSENDPPQRRMWAWN
jgi:hypothetical protein